MTRRESRTAALKLIFQIPFAPDADPSEIIELYKSSNDEKCDKYAEDVFRGVCEHIGDIDANIKKNLQNWNFDRLSKVSLSLLRLSSYEIIYTDVPVQVSINEAVELSKIFDDPKGSSFVNGVLGKIASANGKT